MLALVSCNHRYLSAAYYWPPGCLVPNVKVIPELTYEYRAIPYQQIYRVQSARNIPYSTFSGNSCTQKFNKAHTKQANIATVEYFCAY